MSTQTAYLFAQQLLPQRLFPAPQEFLSTLDSGRDEYLFFLWSQLNKVLGTQEPHIDTCIRPDTGAPGLVSLSVVDAFRVGGWELRIIELPPSAALGAPFLSACAVRGNHARYFTWELSSEGDGRVCELMFEGKTFTGRRSGLRNPGVGASAAAFRAALESKFDESTAPTVVDTPDIPSHPFHDDEPFPQTTEWSSGMRLGLFLLVLVCYLVFQFFIWS